MYQELENYIRQQVLPSVNELSTERKALLNKIASGLKYQKRDRNTIKLLFVCTHNSRRSQIAQAWAIAAMYWFGVNELSVHSAGTQVTAFHTNALDALKRAGMSYQVETTNAVSVSIGNSVPPTRFFSKLYTDTSIPNAAPIAVMTCSDAAKNCPFIPGATLRVSLAYEDPGRSDNQENFEEAYDKTCLLIATEIFYLFQKLK